MTDIFIALIPSYGLLLLFVIVALASLAVPLPASVLVLASGSFAASNDLVLWQVFSTTLLAFLIGDQLNYALARKFGPALLDILKRKPRLNTALSKSEDYLDKHGGLAIFVSHTILSPLCPYINYICGAKGMKWSAFSQVATLGAIVWSLVYVGLGYLFASQLALVIDILSPFMGVILSGFIVYLALCWLRAKWIRFVESNK